MLDINETYVGQRCNSREGITELFLVKMDLNDQHLQGITEALKKNTHINTFGLSENRIRAGVALLNNVPYLTTLFLSGNGLRDDAAAILATHPNLTSLDVSHNKLRHLPNNLLLMILSYVAGNVSRNPKVVTDVCLFVLKLIRPTRQSTLEWCSTDQATNIKFFRRWGSEELEIVKNRQLLMRENISSYQS